MDDAAESGGESVDFDATIRDGRTIIRLSGQRDAAVIVRSASGEQIYLPPENFDQPPTRERQTPYESPYQRRRDSPYQPADSPSESDVDTSDSPYQSASEASDSPYQSADESAYESAETDPESTGLEPTDDGFRIVHPEPVSNLTLLR